MKMPNSYMRSTALAALISFPLLAGAAFAQQAQTDQAQPAQPTQDPAQQQQQSGTSSGQPSGDQQADVVVATVGGAEIRGSDVMTVIGMLPPQLQSQPPQMLVPMALQQLILRELILEEGRGQNLAEDPDVVALVEGSTGTAEEDAIVQVWLDREMANVVTDEAVQEVYGGLQAQGQQDLPPVEQLRPQIEQHLRQQAVQDIQARLQQDADIVLYDPAGRPLEQQDGAATQSGGATPQGGATQDRGAEPAKDGAQGEASDATTGSSGSSGDATKGN